MLHLQTPKMGSRQACLMNLGNFEPARVKKSRVSTGVEDFGET
jgi:hypothetical protein